MTRSYLINTSVTSATFAESASSAPQRSIYQIASSSRLQRFLFSGALALSPLSTSAQEFDTTQGRRGIAEQKKYHAEQKDRAQRSASQIDGESVIHHPYYEGTDRETIIKNNLYDKAVILNPETYEECLDYVQIGWCATPRTLPNGMKVVVRTPFVRYFGPWQKGEEVPEPFRTGYMEKDVIKEEKKAIIDPGKDLKYYEEDGFAKFMVEEELKYSREVAIPYLNTRLGKNLSNNPVPTANPMVIKKTQKAIEARGPNNLGEASMAQDGFVFNEYHLFPSLDTMYDPGPNPEEPNHPQPGPATEMLPPTDNPFYGWCHARKSPIPFLGESAGNFPFSRISAQTKLKFPEVKLLIDNPLNCIGFNINAGLTPAQLAGLSPTGSGAVCQGINQGAWVPVTNRVHTTYQTTAAAIGLTRSRLANRLMPGLFYDIEPKRDKVQWIQNDRMDGASVLGKNAAGVIGKKCSMLEKFVLDYERGNLKIGPLTDGAEGPGRDHWNVLAHWRKIKCCPQGGVVESVTDPTEDAQVITE